MPFLKVPSVQPAVSSLGPMPLVAVMSEEQCPQSEFTIVGLLAFTPDFLTTSAVTADFVIPAMKPAQGSKSSVYAAETQLNPHFYRPHSRDTVVALTAGPVDCMRLLYCENQPSIAEDMRKFTASAQAQLAWEKKVRNPNLRHDSPIFRVLGQSEVSACIALTRRGGGREMLAILVSYFGAFAGLGCSLPDFLAAVASISDRPTVESIACALQLHR